MNGAEHGDATTTASAPDSASLRSGFFAFHDATDEGTNWRTSKTPDRFSASTKNSTASSAIVAGDCSWNPQPSCAPAARNAISAPASNQNDTMTPAPNASPWCRAAAPLSRCAAKPRTLSDRTGNTHGIRLRRSPPTRANTIAVPSDKAVSPSARSGGCNDRRPCRRCRRTGDDRSAQRHVDGDSAFAPGSPETRTPARRLNSPTRWLATGKLIVQSAP